MKLKSMTGFADMAGQEAETSWNWEARSVNGRGLDLRLRLPDGFESLEAPLRQSSKALSRGSVTITLRLARSPAASAQRINPAVLEVALDALATASKAASDRGLEIAPVTPADLVMMRGVLETDTALPSDNENIVAAIKAQIEPLIGALTGAREVEGASLEAVLASQIDRLGELASAARTSAEARSARTGELLGARLAAVLEGVAAIDEARLAQELALLAVKADITEEIDRLESHVAAARGYLASKDPVGRKLDFLTQEFNREANTLCSKAGTVELTEIGLEMKVVIDQMREQVQNVV
jgi:uncharacterized protein (TIGR00255 family)